MFYDKFRAHVEAILFASGDPIAAERIGKMLDIPAEHIEDIIFDLKEELGKEQHGITIRQVAGGYQMCTKKELAGAVDKLAMTREANLSQAAMETLAIVAFRQPITKQEIEFIRGVKSDRILGNLLDLGMVREAGRKDAAGRPILYATTREFLAAFGLNSLLDLPKLPDKIFPEEELESLFDEQM
jgi:segregation and condensation protein B